MNGVVANPNTLPWFLFARCVRLFQQRAPRAHIFNYAHVSRRSHKTGFAEAKSSIACQTQSTWPLLGIAEFGGALVADALICWDCGWRPERHAGMSAVLRNASAQGQERGYAVLDPCFHLDLFLQYILIITFMKVELYNKVIRPEASGWVEVMDKHARVQTPLMPRSEALPGQKAMRFNASSLMIVARYNNAADISLVRKPDLVPYEEPVWVMSDIELPPAFCRRTCRQLSLKGNIFTDEGLPEKILVSV